jgi:hypothetical protein
MRALSWNPDEGVVSVFDMVHYEEYADKPALFSRHADFRVDPTLFLEVAEEAAREWLHGFKSDA